MKTYYANNREHAKEMASEIANSYPFEAYSCQAWDDESEEIYFIIGNEYEAFASVEISCSKVK